MEQPESSELLHFVPKLLGHKENVIGVAPNFRRFIAAVMAARIHSSFVAELVAKFIHSLGLRIVQAQRKHAQLRQGMQLIRLGDAVMVFINPHRRNFE